MPEGERNGEGAVLIGGDNMPFPGGNRVNWSAKYWGDQFWADILYVQEFLGQTLGTPCTSKKIFEGGRLGKKGRH